MNLEKLIFEETKNKKFAYNNQNQFVFIDELNLFNELSCFYIDNCVLSVSIDYLNLIIDNFESNNNEVAYENLDNLHTYLHSLRILTKKGKLKTTSDIFQEFEKSIDIFNYLTNICTQHITKDNEDTKLLGKIVLEYNKLGKRLQENQENTKLENFSHIKSMYMLSEESTTSYKKITPINTYTKKVSSNDIGLYLTAYKNNIENNISSYIITKDADFLFQSIFSDFSTNHNLAPKILFGNEDLSFRSMAFDLYKLEKIEK